MPLYCIVRRLSTRSHFGNQELCSYQFYQGLYIILNYKNRISVAEFGRKNSNIFEFDLEMVKHKKKKSKCTQCAEHIFAADSTVGASQLRSFPIKIIINLLCTYGFSSQAHRTSMEHNESQWPIVEHFRFFRQTYSFQCQCKSINIARCQNWKALPTSLWFFFSFTCTCCY